MKPIVVLLFVFFNWGYSYGIPLKGGSYSEKANNISMLELIVVPEKYSGKMINVNGYLINIGGFNFLFFSRETSARLDFSNAIFVDSDIFRKDVQEYLLNLLSQNSLSGKYLPCLIQGQFFYDESIDNERIRRRIEVTYYRGSVMGESEDNRLPVESRDILDLNEEYEKHSGNQDMNVQGQPTDK